MGGGFNPVESIEKIVNKMEKQPTYFIGYQTPIEETQHWEKFCLKQRITSKHLKKICYLDVKTRAQHMKPMLHSNKFKAYLKIREGELWKEDQTSREREREKERRITELQERLVRQAKTIDDLNESIETNRFLSKLRVERYQELNNLHFTKYPARDSSPTKHSLEYRKNLNSFVIYDYFKEGQKRKWRVIFESWTISGLYPSFEPRGIKSSLESPASNPSSTAAASVSEDGPGNTSSNNSKSESDGTNGKSSVSVKSSAGYCVCESCSQFQD